MSAVLSSMEVVDVPSGYRFLPTDLELVRDYLCKKITNQKLPSNVPVVEYDIYATEPWNLPVNNKIDTISSSRTCYFVKLFDGRKRKRVVNPSCDGGHGVIVLGGKRKRRRRRGGGGFWKWIAGGRRATRYIHDESSRPIGIKKSFEFHANAENNKDGTTTTTTWKTNWIMDEYSINSQRSQPWTLCTIRKKDGEDEDDDDDEVQVLPLPQVEQQGEHGHQPDHDLPNRELEILEKIKNIKKNIKVCQMQIWHYQYHLRKFNELRIFNRDMKHMKDMLLQSDRESEIRRQDPTKKSTLLETAERKKPFLKVEEAAIRAGSYHQVPIPSGRFKKIRICSNI